MFSLKYNVVAIRKGVGGGGGPSEGDREGGQEVLS